MDMDNLNEIKLKKGQFSLEMKSQPNEIENSFESHIHIIQKKKKKKGNQKKKKILIKSSFEEQIGALNNNLVTAERKGTLEKPFQLSEIEKDIMSAQEPPIKPKGEVNSAVKTETPEEPKSGIMSEIDILILKKMKKELRGNL